MASIRRRPGPSGQSVWQVQVRRQGQPAKTKTFERKQDAEKWARQIERRVDLGYALAAKEEEQLTMADAIGRYLQEPSVKAHQSYAREAARARQLAHSLLGRLNLATLGGADLARYRDRRLQAGRAANTVRLELAVISSVYKLAASEWGMSTLRMPLIRKPRLPAGRERRLEAGEETRLLACADSHGGEVGAIIRFALATAMRRGEIVAMRREDIDRVKRILHVRHTKDATEERGREVPLSREAMRVLDALPRRLDGRVWKITADGVTRAFERVCKRAGIENLRFHDLRHESVSRLIERGLSPMEAAAVSGHKTMQMVRRYTHLRAEDVAKKLG